MLKTEDTKVINLEVALLRSIILHFFTKNPDIGQFFLLTICNFFILLYDITYDGKATCHCQTKLTIRNCCIAYFFAHASKVFNYFINTSKFVKSLSNSIFHLFLRLLREDVNFNF